MLTLRSLHRVLAAAGCGLLLAACGGRPDNATLIPLPPTTAQPRDAGALLDDLDSVFNATPGPTAPPLEPNLPAGSGLLWNQYDQTLRPASGGPAQPANARGVLLADPQRGMASGWSPDGRTIIFLDLADEGEAGMESQVFRYAAVSHDGSNARPLGQVGPSTATTCINVKGGIDHQVWSPDSSKAAFFVEHTRRMGPTSCLSGDADPRHLYVIDLKANTLSSVLADPEFERYPSNVSLAWSPDSATVAYLARTETRSKLKTFRLGDAQPREVMSSRYLGGLFWPSDGGIVVEGDCGGHATTEVCQVEPASGAVTPLYRTAEAGDGLSLLLLSPDEQWFLAEAIGRDHLLLINRRTGATETVTTDPGFFSLTALWSPDSRYLGIRHQDRYTYVYEVGAGQPPRRLTDESIDGWLREQ